MDTMWSIHTMEYQVSNKKEQITDPHNNIDELQVQYAK